MSDSAMEETEIRLRATLAGRQYAEAETTLNSYCALAKAHLDAATVQSPDHRQTLTRTLEVLEWARIMLCASRAAHAESYKHLSALTRFFPSPGPEPSGKLGESL